jgi:hypothetical protein
VSVDLMSTGVDIPDLEFIVFLRQVKSRILFEQMLGRGTRKGEKFPDKSHFTVFDSFAGVCGLLRTPVPRGAVIAHEHAPLQLGPSGRATEPCNLDRQDRPKRELLNSAEPEQLGKRPASATGLHKYGDVWLARGSCQFGGTRRFSSSKKCSSMTTVSALTNSESLVIAPAIRSSSG